MRIGRSGGIAGLLVILALILLTDAGDRGGSGSGRGDRPGGEPARRGSAVVAEVRRVVDGDTIEVELDGESEDVRYIGVDTPETVKPGAPVECFGKQASRRNEELVAGRRVRLVFDRERRDRYGRLLAYVYTGGTFVNAELVRGGYARTLEIEPNTAMAAKLEQLETRAGERGRGLWGAC